MSDFGYGALMFYAGVLTGFSVGIVVVVALVAL